MAKTVSKSVTSCFSEFLPMFLLQGFLFRVLTTNTMSIVYLQSSHHYHYSQISYIYTQYHVFYTVPGRERRGCVFTVRSYRSTNHLLLRKPNRVNTRQQLIKPPPIKESKLGNTKLQPTSI